MNCYEDIYWKWIFIKRHKHSSWIFFNSVQQLDSGRTRQAWQMSLQPMVQLYKRNVSGESGDQNNLQFGDHWSIKSSLCGYPTKTCESCKFWGRGWAFFLQSLQLSRRSSWWLGLWRPNVSFCLFLVEVPEPSEPDVEINGTCWLPHYKQHVRPPGQIVTQKLWQIVTLKPSWNKYSASHWSDIYHTAYNCEIFLFPLLIIVATYIRIYTLLSRCSENNFLS